MITPAMLAFDREHLWHPYAETPLARDSVGVEDAEGVRLRLSNGTVVVDAMSSWWCAIHGYRHPVLDTVMREQIGRMSHVMFGGLTHAPAIELGKLLLDCAPEGLEKVFYADSGSVAVEVAMKMALQYWRGLGIEGRNRFLTIRGGYHGDTFGAMSVCDPVGGMHTLFSGVLPEHLFAPEPRISFHDPWDAIDTAEFADLAERHAPELAAVILEPIVQGAGGMRFHHPQYLRTVRAVCDELQLPLILDEIATGFGRSGTLFACEHAGIVPDILCVGKALTGGYMTLATTLATGRIAHAISRGTGPLMHGPTFMANPLACAVGRASVQMVLDMDLSGTIGQIESALTEQLAPCRDLPGVADVRVLGAIGVVETREPIDAPSAQEIALANGVWLRPFGKLLYTMPPYIIDDDDLRKITTAMHAIAQHLG